MRIQLLAALAVVFGLATPSAHAADQIGLAASGRFDELQRTIEAQAAQKPLDIPDRHALCFAYSKTKQYALLDQCLTALEQLAAGTRNRRTRLFGLDDVTPAIKLMRADAAIDQAQYAAAAQYAQDAATWIEKEEGEEDLLVQSWSTQAVALALQEKRAEAIEVTARMDRYSKGLRWVIGGGSSTAFAFAMAKAYMAQSDYLGVLSALESDRFFKFRMFLDDVVSGAALFGTSNWLWIDLPRSFMIHKARMEVGRYAEAREGFDVLLKTRQVAANGEIFWLLLYDRGRLAEIEGQPVEAIGFYERSVEVIEQQRASINTEANKIGFVGDKQAVYGKLISALVQAGKTETAFEYMERAKARALVDLLASKDDFAVPPTQAAAIASALDGYRQALQDSQKQAPVDMSKAGGDSTRSATAQRRNELNQVAPELASLIAVSAVPLSEIRARLHPTEAIIEFYFQGRELFVSVVSSSSVRSAKLDAKEIEPMVRSLRKNIEGLEAAAQKDASALYDRLLRPIEKDIAGKELLIIPHGVLHYLPFAALHDGKHYLIETTTLRYLPSASVLKFLKPRSGKSIDSLLVFGNPDLGDPKLDLPNAELEAQAIAKFGANSELLTRKGASEHAFKLRAPGFRYLHIASHGEFNSDKALNSRLLLARDAADDGSLTVSELYGVRLDADLVTLSACETGLGKVLNGDDLVGLTRGFLYAGSSNVVASLWQVDDEATAELMTHFYTQLKAGVGKREALRQAQMEAAKKFPEPFFWAPFFLTGSGV
jgi:CHAT domain-containing protein